MYKFEDTLRTTGQDGGILPAEALAINGRYLDEVIPGFNTLTASGRELLTRSVTTKKVGNSDGEIFMGSTHPTRTITVKFQLVSKTPQEFRKNFEQLTKIIDQPEVKLSFHDDESVFYVGTHVQTGTIPDGKLNVIATMTFQCSDPKAHSKTEKTATNNGTADTITFTNNGTDSTPINVTAEMVGDNGFVGLTLGDHVYQVGVPQQVDGVKYDDAEVLIPGNPQPNPSTGLLNDAKFVTVPTDQWKPRKQGVVSLIHPETKPNGNVLVQSDTGQQPSERMPIETSITYKIPTDKTTKTEGAKNFSFRFIIGFHSYDPFDSGQIVATVHSKDGKAMASILMQDLYVGKEDYVLQYHVDNQKVYEIKPNIWMLNSDYPNYSIVKYNEKITLASPWQTKTINAPQLKDAEAYYISFSFLKWFPYVTPAIYEVTNWNFWEGYADLYHDTPNYFKAGDVLRVDSESNEVYINGQRTQDAVDIGSQPLLAVPGENTLGIVKSDWAKMPKVNIDYRERWL